MATAHHEAGHAVVLVVQGHSVDKLTIVPGEDSLGHCLHPSVFGYEFSTRKEQRAIAREIILACYAGWHAEKLFDPDANQACSREDWDNAFNVSREYQVFPRGTISVNDDLHVAYLDKLQKEARSFVKKQRRAVEILAQELFKRETLEGDEIKLIVESVN